MKRDEGVNYGYQFNYRDHRIRKVYPLDTIDMDEIKEDRQSADGFFMWCEACGSYMIFREGPTGDLDGSWMCEHCGVKVRERTAYTKLDRDNRKWAAIFEDKIPDGCAACGGPWPECIISCRMIDD